MKIPYHRLNPIVIVGTRKSYGNTTVYYYVSKETYDKFKDKMTDEEMITMAGFFISSNGVK
jgi:hypothetical protein